MGYADRRGPIRGNRRGTYDAGNSGPYGGGRWSRKREFQDQADLDTQVIEVSSNRLYVHNLAWRVSWQDLKDHFREAGEVVRAEIFTEGPGGRSKGCGIVEMASVDDAANAVEKLMDSELQGRRILIREDRESRRRGDEHRDDRGESPHRQDDADNEPVEEMLRGVGPFGESGESTRDGLTDLATKQ
jgi:arginine/serine-rich splicing factor 4/5/6